ncbi:MAG: sodium ion-translocating decarboxylase subunit beta [Firmicutes bacterium]|nr:sodium ion-translocating decarboxylase subunit beta [Bacillota bacterium]
MKKDKMRKAVTILTIIAIVMTVISVGINFLAPMYLSHKLVNEVDKVSSVGIIGGADGPTAIYLTSQSFSYISTVIFALLSIVGLFCISLIKKTSK